MSVVHLMPWSPVTDSEGEEISFRRLTQELRQSADVAYVVQAAVTQPCDHSDAPEGHEVICSGANIYVRATYGRLLVTLGNGSAQNIDVASTPEAAQNAAREAMAALVHLEGFEQLAGPEVGYPSEDTIAAYKEAQHLKELHRRMESEARKMTEDPEMLRKLGLEMVKKARALGADAEDDTGERVGQYV